MLHLISNRWRKPNNKIARHVHNNRCDGKKEAKTNVGASDRVRPTCAIACMHARGNCCSKRKTFQIASQRVLGTSAQHASKASIASDTQLTLAAIYYAMRRVCSACQATLKRLCARECLLQKHRKTTLYKYKLKFGLLNTRLANRYRISHVHMHTPAPPAWRQAARIAHRTRTVLSFPCTIRPHGAMQHRSTARITISKNRYY
jgi:hypothetical protein